MLQLSFLRKNRAQFSHLDVNGKRSSFWRLFNSKIICFVPCARILIRRVIATKIPSVLKNLDCQNFHLSINGGLNSYSKVPIESFQFLANHKWRIGYFCFLYQTPDNPELQKCCYDWFIPILKPILIPNHRFDFFRQARNRMLYTSGGRFIWFSSLH